MAGSSGAIRAGRAFVELFTDDSKLAAGLNAAKRKLEAFGRSIKDLGLKISAVGAAVTGPLLATAKEFADMGHELQMMSEKTGISVETLSQLGFAAKECGVEAETLTGAFARMDRTLVQAEKGNKKAVEALSDLGLTLADLKGKSPEAQFALIAQRISEFEDPAERAAMAMQVFGRGGAALLPLLNQGAAGITGLMDKARELGLTISGEDARAASQFHDAMLELWAVLQKCWFTIGSALAPVLKGLAQWVTAVVIGVTKWIGQHKQLVVAILGFGAAITALGLGLVAFGVVVTYVGAAIGALGTIASVVGGILGALGSVLAAICSPVGLVVAAIVALGVIILKVTGAGAKALKWLGDMFKELWKDACLAFDGISDALAAGDITLAARILWLTLKMEWTKGCATLSEIWTKTCAGWKIIASEAWYGVLKAGESTWHAIAAGWIETTNFLSNCWTRFVQGVTKGWNWVKGLFDESFDSQAANKLVDAAANSDVAKREKERDEELAKEDAIHKKVLNQIDAEREAKLKAIVDARDASLKETQDEVDAARKAWNDARAKAKQERKDKEDAVKATADAAAGAVRNRKLPDKDDVSKAINDASARGTFNASSGAMLGMRMNGGETMERVAKSSEKSEKHLEKIQQELSEFDGAEFGV